MASIVKPITTFEKTITRAESLITHYESNPALTEKDDLLRAAVMLAIAGFDRYFTAKYCDVLVPYLQKDKRISEAMLSRLEEAGLGPKFALELVVSKRPFRKIRTIVQNSLSRHTTHRMDVIDDLFLSVALKGLSENAEKKADRKNLRKRISKLVDLRNEIAHDGHADRSGKPRRIDCADVKSRISETKLFVEKCNEIIDKKFGIKAAVSA